MTLDLGNHIDRLKLISQMEAEIDRSCRDTMQDGPRKHLGASVIGDPCSAKLWNDFRWLHQEKFEGRMLRLFDRGKREEFEFVKMLRSIGFEIKEFDDEEKQEQFRISGCNGHYGGSLDAQARAPERYQIKDWLIVVAEFKTHGEKSFAKLKADKMRISKPMHYIQMCCYGHAYKRQFGLYFAVNKNTDEYYLEIVELNWSVANSALLKANRIINSQTQPQKIATTKTFFQCKYCHYSPICFDGALPEKNCRSCKFAVPGPNGKWECFGNPNYADQYLEDSLIKSGCDEWSAIINGAN